MKTSEARKRGEEAQAHLPVDPARYARDVNATRTIERRREVAADALAEVYPHAGFIEADALLLALEDRGARIEMQT